MPKFTILPHMSLHFVLYEDERVEDNTDLEDEHTITAYGDLSPSPGEMLGFPPNDLRRRNQLRLKARRKSPQYSPPIPDGKFWDPLTFSEISTPLTPAEFFNRFKHSVRRAFQLAQAEAAEAEVQSCAADSGESTFSDSNASYDSEPGQSVTVKDFPSTYDLIEEWRKLPLRPGIPKWDIGD